MGNIDVGFCVARSRSLYRVAPRVRDQGCHEHRLVSHCCVCDKDWGTSCLGSIVWLQRQGKLMQEYLLRCERN